MPLKASRSLPTKPKGRRRVKIRHRPETCHVRYGSEGDMSGAKRHVRFAPESGHRGWPSGRLICAKAGSRLTLFDHLVGAGEQCRWHNDVKRLCGLQIDHKLV